MNSENIDKIILDKLKVIESDIKELQKEFYIFKGKAFGFMALLSAIINYGIKFLGL